jgi:hypothetical protein
MSQNSSGLLQINDTWIESGNSNTTVIAGEGADLTLWVSHSIGPGLFGGAYFFDVNWQIIQVGGLIVASNNWLTQTAGKSYPVSVDGFFLNGSGNYNWFCSVPRATDFNVRTAGKNAAQTQNQGGYILQVYMFVDTSSTYDNRAQYNPMGTSQWALGDQLFFWCE